MEPYKKYRLFQEAGNDKAAVAAVRRPEDGRIDERIISAASGEMYSLNSECLVEAVYPDLPPRSRNLQNPVNDPDNEAFNALYWALQNIINDRIDHLVNEGAIIAVWESSFQVPAWLTPGKLWQLQAFGYVEDDNGSWVTTWESENNNYYRQGGTQWNPHKEEASD